MRRRSQQQLALMSPTAACARQRGSTQARHPSEPPDAPVWEVETNV